MTHHSCQDIAAMCALPDMRVYLPSDRFQTSRLIEALLEDELPAYVRVSRSATEDVYDERTEFTLNRAKVIAQGADVTLVACGEMVPYAVEARRILEEKGISTGLIDMYCLKPFDRETLLQAAGRTGCFVTVEEHAPHGGLGSLVCQALSQNIPKRVLQLALPDGHIIPGENKEVFAAYGMDSQGIAGRAAAFWEEGRV